MTTSSDQPDPGAVIRRAQELLWRSDDAADKGRGPKRSLRVDQIVEAAIALADREGMEALSMRRVARELGVGTMSLYRYLPGKDELLALMLDRVSDLGECPAVPGSGWREVVATVARRTWELYSTHPWLIHVNWARPTIGPGALDNLEHFVAGLGGVELSDPEKVMVLSVVDAYTVGAVRSHLMYTSAAEETGLTEERFWEIQFPYLARAVESGRYPALASMTEDAFSAGWDETFDLGLQLLLDGLEVALARRHSPAERGESPATVERGPHPHSEHSLERDSRGPPDHQ